MMIDYKALGQRIRDIRKEKKMTQAELAEEADISDTYVCYIESGKKRLSMEVMIRIAESLEVSADRILYDISPDNTAIFSSEFRKLLSDCNPGEKEAIYIISCSAKTALRKYKPASGHSR